MQVDIDVNMMALCRDARRRIQNEILSRFPGSSCLSFTLNIPGTVKDRESYRKAFRSGLQNLTSTISLQILYAYIRFPPTGPEAFLSVQLPENQLKSLTIQIERTHPCGRIFDMDVLSGSDSIISRRDLGCPPRKCLICEEEAAACSRSRRHSLDQLLEKIELITGNI